MPNQFPPAPKPDCPAAAHYFLRFRKTRVRAAEGSPFDGIVERGCSRGAIWDQSLADAP
jgi:hypothetical protein